MRTFFTKFILFSVVALALGFGQARAQDDQSVSFQTFYDQLGSQGTWVQTDDYGYVWQPTVSDPNWRPYADGHWVDTDDGWTWVANDSEPWGWATYHYGRWVNLDDDGWVWVPGYTWAPAWVSWRYGGGYCGWAPLPPQTSVGIDFGGGGIGFGFGFHIGGDCDTAFGIGAGCYNFVPVGCLGDRDYHSFYVNRSNNYTIINRTTNITNVNVTKNVTNNYNGTSANRFGHVRTGGPSLAEVNKESRTPVQHASLTQADRPGNGSLHGNSLAIYAPRVNPDNAHTAKPSTVAKTLSHPSVNRGTDINRPLAVNSTIKPAGPSAQETQAARLAQENAPANARIATNNTRITHPLTQPLPSLQANHPATGVSTVKPNDRLPENKNVNGSVATSGHSTPAPNENRSTVTGTSAHPDAHSGIASTEHAAQKASTRAPAPAIAHHAAATAATHEPHAVSHTANVATHAQRPAGVNHAPAVARHSAPVNHPQPVHHSAPAVAHHAAAPSRPHPSAGGGHPAVRAGGGGAKNGDNGKKH